MLHADAVSQVAGGDQRRLVANVGDVGAREAWRQCSHFARHLVLVQVGFQALQVDFEDGGASLDVRQANINLSVEAARSEEGGIQHVNSVGRRHDNHIRLGTEAVHFDEQLVQSVFLLTLAANVFAATLAADRVDLVNE